MYAMMIVIFIIGVVVDAVVFGTAERWIRRRYGLIDAASRNAGGSGVAIAFFDDDRLHDVADLGRLRDVDALDRRGRTGCSSA